MGFLCTRAPLQEDLLLLHLNDGSEGWSLRLLSCDDFLDERG